MGWQTSGVLVVAKDRAHAAECVHLFQTRLVQKEYLAVVKGHVEWDEKTVDAPIAPGAPGEFCMQVRSSALGEENTGVEAEEG